MPVRIFIEDKICVKCGEKFNRHRMPSGRLEDAQDFKKRKFCCPKCFISFHRGENHFAFSKEGRMRKDGYIRISVDGKRKYLHRHKVEKTLNRELSLNEHVHHKDENKSHNEHDNFSILSPSEHMKLHNKNRKRDEKGRFLN